MNTKATLDSFAGDEAILKVESGAVIRCDKTILPAEAEVGQTLYVTVSTAPEAVTPQEILNEALNVNDNGEI